MRRALSNFVLRPPPSKSKIVRRKVKSAVPPAFQQERMSELSELIGQVNRGQPGTQGLLFAAAYPELRKRARSRLRDGGRNTLLDTTALVHESYLRFLNRGQLTASDRRAFFAYTSCVMRSVIIDAVREKLAARPGGEIAGATGEKALDLSCLLAEDDRLSRSPSPDDPVHARVRSVAGLRALSLGKASQARALAAAAGKAFTAQLDVSLYFKEPLLRIEQQLQSRRRASLADALRCFNHWLLIGLISTWRQTWDGFHSIPFRRAHGQRSVAASFQRFGCS